MHDQLEAALAAWKETESAVLFPTGFMANLGVLTTVAGTFRARVVAARLESEGIDSQLRGALDGPYGLTIGDMARVDVYVPDDQLEDARLVLLVDASSRSY